MKYRIKELREDKDLKQTTLASYLNIKQNNYSYLENEKIEIKVDYLIKIADFYNVSVDYLLNRTDVQKPYPRSKRSI